MGDVMRAASALGFVGAVVLAVCAAPLTIQTVIDGHADGVNGWFLALWLIGELVMLVYVLLERLTLPLILNYAANVAMVGIVSVYKWVI